LGANTKFEFLNQGYLPFRLSNQARQWAADILKSNATVRENRAFAPTAAQATSRIWWKLQFAGRGFPTGRRAVVGAFAIIALLAVAFSRRSKARFSALLLCVLSFSVMTLQWMLLAALQIIAGNLYSLFAAGVSVFMLGVAAGSFVALQKPWWFNARRMATLTIAASVLFLIFVNMGGNETHIYAADAFLFGLTAMAGALAGSGFVMYSRGVPSQPRLGMYSADLAGAAIASIWVSLYAVPALGFTGALISVIVLNLITAVGYGCRTARS
jgi:hypothetical protein